MGTGKRLSRSSRQAAYEIRVQGQIDASWSQWFDGLDLSQEVTEQGEAITVLTGTVADQAALRGLLARLWNLDLTVISVHRRESA